VAHGSIDTIGMIFHFSFAIFQCSLERPNRGNGKWEMENGKFVSSDSGLAICKDPFDALLAEN
jgi:hypothetical protein